MDFYPCVWGASASMFDVRCVNPGAGGSSDMMDIIFCRYI